MSDFDIVREMLKTAEQEWEFDPVLRTLAADGLAALDRIEQDVAGLKVELADASAELARLRRVGWGAVDSLGDDIGNYVAKSERLYALRTALEGGGSAEEEA